jgi:uncharacterized HAD superfamily protein
MRIGVDIDGTLTTSSEGFDYAARLPNLEMIEWVNKQFADGHHITLFTARLKIDRSVTSVWLKKHNVRYNDIIFEKPKFELYIDDIAKRPEEVV